MIKVPSYYIFNSVEEDGTRITQSIFDKAITLKGRKEVARYIIFDILRYAYRFNKKSQNAQKQTSDLNKIAQEIEILKSIRLNWWHRYILRTYVFFKTYDEKDFFAENNNVSKNQVNLIEAIQKFDLKSALYFVELLKKEVVIIL